MRLRCPLNGSLHKSQDVFRLDIRTKPGFTPGLESRVVDPETDVALNCSATGYPKPLVHWEDGRRRLLEEGGLLVLHNVRKSATFTCVAKNRLGNATISVNVTLSGLPFSPKNLIAKSKTGYTLTVSWEDGEAGIPIDQHDIKYRKKGDLYWKVAYGIRGVPREYTLKDLNPYTNYEVQVFAQNRVGRSKGSPIVVMLTDETGEL